MKETGWRRCGSTSLYGNETPTGANIPVIQATDLRLQIVHVDDCFVIFSAYSNVFHDKKSVTND